MKQSGYLIRLDLKDSAFQARLADAKRLGSPLPVKPIVRYIFPTCNSSCISPESLTDTLRIGFVSKEKCKKILEDYRADSKLAEFWDFSLVKVKVSEILEEL